MRRLSFSGSLSLAAALAAAIVVTRPGYAAGQPCARVVSEQLERFGINRDDVREVQFVRVTTPNEDRRFLQYEAWVSLRSCSGYVVVKLDRSCRIMETYTRGECRRPGTGHF